MYASEEEALAAAEELYGRYLRIANKIGQGGWKDTSGYAEVARGDALESELSSAAEFLAKGYRQTGDISFDSMSLQQLSDRGPSHVAITVYLCADVSDVGLVDKSGQSVVPTGRPDRQPIEMDLDDSEGSLKVSRSDVWSGSDFC